MRSAARWLPIVVFAVLAALFAYLNAGVSVPVHLGLFTLAAVPVAVLVFAAFLTGMVTMFLVGLRQDLRIRRALRRSGLDDSPARPRSDHEAAARHRPDPSDTLW